MEEKLKSDIEEIRNIMDRSTRFISLSGLSGIAAGIVGILGVYTAYFQFFAQGDYLVNQPLQLNTEQVMTIVLIALTTLILALGSAIWITVYRTKKRGLKVLTPPTLRLLSNLFTPLLGGGLFCLLLLLKGYIGLLPAASLLVYGLSLINASKFSLKELRLLGFLEILLSLFALQWIEFSLAFWAIGFGGLHLVFGFILYRKYEA